MPATQRLLLRARRGAGGLANDLFQPRTFLRVAFDQFCTLHFAVDHRCLSHEPCSAEQEDKKKPGERGFRQEGDRCDYARHYPRGNPLNLERGPAQRVPPAGALVRHEL